jgi:hypothetical protein
MKDKSSQRSNPTHKSMRHSRQDLPTSLTDELQKRGRMFFPKKPVFFEKNRCKKGRWEGRSCLSQNKCVWLCACVRGDDDHTSKICLGSQDLDHIMAYNYLRHLDNFKLTHFTLYKFLFMILWYNIILNIDRNC